MASSINNNSSNERQTYWCHECDMGVSFVVTTTTSSNPLICPQCHGDFLEEMDSSLPNPNLNPNPDFSSLPPPLHTFPVLSPPQTLTPTTTDDDDLDPLHIPYTITRSDAYLLDRFIQHLTDPDEDAGGGGGGGLGFHHHHHHLHHHHHHHGSSPASKSSVESIPTIKITSSFLASDTLICAVCKDEFVIDVEAKQLPCNHIYHFDCILPWLSQHNSCPVCRFLLPIDESERKASAAIAGGGAAGSVGIRFESLMDDDDDEDLFGVGSTLRHIARRHRLVFPFRSTNSLGSSSSPTQMAQAETSSVGPANSGETVSSCPVEGSVSVVASGGGLGGRVSSSGRLDDDGDTVISEVRGGLLD